MYVFILCVRGGGVCTTAHVCRSEDNFVNLILFFLLYVGSRDHTQVVRLAQEVPYLLTPLTAPEYTRLLLQREQFASSQTHFNEYP